MNLVDLILLIGLCWMAFRGCRTGLVRSLIGLATLILAYGLGLSYGGAVSVRIYGESAGHVPALPGFVCVFVATLIACYLLGRMLQAMLKATPFGVVDTLCGGVLGLAQGLLLLGLLILLLRAHSPHPGVKAYIDDARLTRHVQQASLVVMDAVRAAVPSASELYRHLVPDNRESSSHPFAERMTRGTGEAWERVKELIEKSQSEEKQASDNARTPASDGRRE